MGKGWRSGGAETHQETPAEHTAALCGHTIQRFCLQTLHLFQLNCTQVLVRQVWPLLREARTCVCTHHDDQQDVLEVIPEAQSVGAEKGKVSLQELQTKQRLESTCFNGSTKTTRYLTRLKNATVCARTMNAKEMKRKPVTSFTYGPCPTTTLILSQKDMGLEPRWQSSGRRRQES